MSPIYLCIYEYKSSKLFRLQKFEIPRAVCLVSEAWTPESGLLTAAMKLKRKTIESVFSAEIAAMYFPIKKSSINNNAN